MIGREEAVAAIVSRLSHQRLVTIVGPGGIGKTTVALAVAEQMTADYQHGVWLIDLAAIGDPRLVPSAVATALGLEIHAEDLLPGLVANLSDKRMLLLDTCEHVIDAAASLAAAILNSAPGVSILATSRERLAVAGEREYRLGPLAAPHAVSRPTAAETAVFPAVQLFVERVSTVVEDFSLTDANAPLIGEICRKLDGSPLAIEFAAPRVEVLGVVGLAAHLDDSLPVLSARRRTSAMPRHRTMRAVLDWSYGLLREDEQQFFRALGIFTGGFTVEAAAATALGAVNARDAIDRLADLVAKSLVVADVSGAKPRFRLLDTTRAYAMEQLDASGERERVARRHAEYHRDLFERAEIEWKARPTAEWLGEYGWQIDNLRAALDWAFSSGGDASLGVALTAAAVPLWMLLSLVDECRGRVERALAALETETNRHPLREMRLHAAMGTTVRYTKGATPENEAAWTKALEMAESLDDAEYQLRSLWGLWAFNHARGRHRIAVELAQRFCAVSESRASPQDRLFGLQMIGAAHHHLGDQPTARRYLEEGLPQYGLANHGTAVDPRGGGGRRRPTPDWVQTDFRVAARAFLARVLWFQGFSDQAVRTAETSVAEAEATGHALSLTLALALAACPIALLVGDLAAAERYGRMLLDQSTRHALALWRAYCHCYEGTLVIKRGQIGSGLGLLRAGFAELSAAQTADFRLVKLLAAEALGHSGRIADGLTAIEEAIDHSERTEERWLIAELLRVKGGLLILQDADGAVPAARDHFRQALDWARRQGALSWELRAARSLARLLADQGRRAEAKTLLQPIYDRFTEGFGTADLIAAKHLLDELCDGRRD